MVETEIILEGDNTKGYKDVSHKSKSRSSRRERSSVSKEPRGDEGSVRRSKRSHRHSPDDHKENNVVEQEFFALERKNQEVRSKSTLERKKHKSDNIESGVKIKGKKNSEKSSSAIDQIVKPSKSKRRPNIYTTSKENLVHRTENIKDGVKFDGNVKYVDSDDRFLTEKSKISFKPKSEKQRDVDKEKLRYHKSSRRSKHYTRESSETLTTGSSLRHEKSNERLKITIKTKERVQTDQSKRGSIKREEDLNRSIRKEETKVKKKNYKYSDSIDGITLICSPEIKSKRSSRNSDKANDTSKRREHSEKAYRQKEFKSASRERTKKLKKISSDRSSENESPQRHRRVRSQSERQNSLQKEESMSTRIENRERSRDGRSKKHRSDKSKRHRSERSESRQSGIQKRSRSEKSGTRRSKDVKESMTEDHTDSRSKKGSENHKDLTDIRSKCNLVTSPIETLEEDKKKSKKRDRSKVVLLENQSNNNDDSAGDISRVLSSGKVSKDTKHENLLEYFNSNKISIKDSSINNLNEEMHKCKPTPPIKLCRKEESVSNAVINDKLIMVSNKEDILLKGVQDLTIKELYLMENLKDYELKLNEQFLKKMKRKKREYSSTNEVVSIQATPPDIPVCRLPSVKEIFKISNLTDYERKYKEMQDKRKKKIIDGTLYSAMGRRKLTKFSLESRKDGSIDHKNKHGRSSQWPINNNIRGKTSNNEGGGEIVCNVGYIIPYENDGNAVEGKFFEKGDARSPCHVREIARGFRTLSQTKLAVEGKTEYIHDVDAGTTYLKMCEKFRENIREESKRLLQNLAGNKNWRISIKDSSLQCIKKKPSLSSNDGDFISANSSKLNYVEIKKSKKISKNDGGLKKIATIPRDISIISHKIEEHSEINNDFPWLPSINDRRGCEKNISYAQTFDKNLNKNDRIFISKHAYSPEDFFATISGYPPERLGSEGQQSRESVNLHPRSVVSNSSYTLSMFEREKDLSNLNKVSIRNSDPLNVLKQCDLSREIPEMNILQQQDDTESTEETMSPWIHRSATLERIINEIKESPEKDTNPSPKVLRECRFENKSNKTFSEIEKSKNVLLSYISHINYSSKTRDKRNSLINKSENKSRVIFDGYNDLSGQGNKFALKERTFHDSLSYLKGLNYFKNPDNQNINQRVNQDDPSLICTRSCVSIKTLKNDKNKKSCKKILKASLQSASTTFKCDLKAEERPNGINTKLIISDPSKRTNFLQIQFCGKLNINFNKDKIELGNIDSKEDQKQIESNYNDENRKNITKKKSSDRINLELENGKSPIKTRSQTYKFSSEESSKNNSVSSQDRLNNNSSNISIPESSKTIVSKIKEDKEHFQKILTKVDNGSNEISVEKEENIESKDDQDKNINQNHINSFDLDNRSCLQETNISKSSHSIKSPDRNDNQTVNGKRIELNFTKETKIKNLNHTKENELAEDLQTEFTLIINNENIKHKENDENVSVRKIELDRTDEMGLLKEVLPQDIILNKDASAQTEFDFNYNQQNNIFLCKDACTSSTFECNDKTNFNSEMTFTNFCCNAIDKEKKSYSSSTNSTGIETSIKISTGSCSNNMNSSIDGIAIKLNDQAESSLIINEQPEMNAVAENMFNKPQGINIGFKQTDTDHTKSRFLKQNETCYQSDSSNNFTYDGALRDLQNSSCFQSSQDNHICYKVKNSLNKDDQEKASDEKKKLFLSQSEEEAFKYLLFKGIGKTHERKSSNETSDAFIQMCSNPKLMFSTIKSRLENFKSTSSQIINERSCGNFVSSKIRKAPMCKPILQENKKCYSCLGCTCNQQNNISKIWDRQKHDNDEQGSKYKMETNYDNGLKNICPLKSMRDVPCGENVCMHRINSTNKNCQLDESRYDLNCPRKEVECYSTRYENITGNAPCNFVSKKEADLFVNENSLSRVSTSNQWDSRYAEKNSESFYHLKKTDFNSEQNNLQQKVSHDHGSLSEYCRRHPYRNSSLLVLNKRKRGQTSIPPKVPFRNYPSGSYRSSQIRPDNISYKNIERQTASVTERHQSRLSDTFHEGRIKQIRAARMMTNEEARRHEQLHPCAYQQMKDSLQSNREFEVFYQENENENENDAYKKKQSRKHKFTKQASKIWKSLFKKNKKYEEEILEYEDIPPEQFIGQRPKIQENKLKIKKWLKKISQSKTSDFQSVQEKLFKKLNKIMSSEVTLPLQEVFDIIQKPQFHKDNHSYSGRNRFDRVHTANYLSDDGHFIMITEHLNVRGFLVSIGLKDDVAWEAQGNPELNSRLQSAITEARSWVNKITMSQGLLIYILAVMTPKEVNNYYLQIVEAIINNRIFNVATLLSVMMVLKRYERGKYGIKAVISKEHVRDLVPKQVSETEKRHQENRARFIYLYNIAKRAAAKVNTKVDKGSAGLLARLTASYSPGLKPYLSLLSHYIAQRVINDKGQLTMAVSFLQSLSTRHFDQAKFELNCGLAQNKVVLKETTVDYASLKEMKKTEPKTQGEISDSAQIPNDRLQASWVKRRKFKPLKESTENIVSEKSNLERKPSTMDLLKEQNKP